MNGTRWRKLGLVCGLALLLMAGGPVACNDGGRAGGGDETGAAGAGVAAAPDEAAPAGRRTGRGAGEAQPGGTQTDEEGPPRPGTPGWPGVLPGPDATAAPGMPATPGASEETRCDDELDNDADGAVDCADPDCADTEACAVSCAPIGTIACGQTVTGETTGNSGLIGPSPCGLREETGPEVVYTFDDPTAGSVRFTLSDLEDDLDLFVLQGACDTDRCAAWSATLDDEVAVVDTTAGGPFYIVVDGFLGAAGPFTLRAECEPGATEICDDGQDNDGDGLVDCADPSCATDPACTRPDDPYEENDSLDQAATGVTQAVGLTVHGGDDDWFAVEVCTGGTLEATIGFATAEGDLDLMLVDATLQELASSFSTTDDETLTWQNESGQPVTVYVIVTSFFGQSNRYDLDLRVTGC